MKELIEEHVHSSAHLSKKPHVHPKLAKMFELGGMNKAFVRGEGQYLWDAEGVRYLDLLGGGGVFFLGRNHPKINGALIDVLSMNLPNLCVVNASIMGGMVAEKLLLRWAGRTSPRSCSPTRAPSRPRSPSGSRAR
jgi:ornithine--oxo-acid transaminase